jgi:hypothetical protein
LSFEIAGEDVIQKNLDRFRMICARLVFVIRNYVRSITMLELSVGTLCAIFPMRNIALKGSVQMKHPTTSLLIGACLLVSSAGAVFATDAHRVLGTKGQNGTGGAGVASCGGAQASPPGQVDSLNTNSPFPTLGNPTPSKVYAGSGAGNSGANPKANSQYDNACFQQMP